MLRVADHSKVPIERHAQNLISQPCLSSCLGAVHWARTGFALGLHIVYSNKPAPYRGLETVSSYWSTLDGTITVALSELGAGVSLVGRRNMLPSSSALWSSSSHLA